jgi:hypothetical protein
MVYNNMKYLFLNMQLKIPLGRAMSELFYANRKFERFPEILKYIETVDEE